MSDLQRQLGRYDLRHLAWHRNPAFARRMRSWQLAENVTWLDVLAETLGVDVVLVAWWRHTANLKALAGYLSWAAYDRSQAQGQAN
ncbi:unnamed protein product [Symbiodinium natans]|uniref:Uncharacterized protein n=1 Tax=Symbiodinium natans TaxID=878477 RepID=A0A812V054_9DINO|nr:unnamed protein product [Symbiodinium natans]